MQYVCTSFLQGFCFSNCEYTTIFYLAFSGDVVGAYVDLSADPVNFHFTKNGEDQGVAFSIPKSQLGDQALFPHISSRNVKFEANFGKNKAGEAREPAHAAMEGYTWVADSEGVKNTPR